MITHLLSVTDTAFGTGTGTGNDDSAAIQACIDAAAGETNATVYFPPASYNLGSPIVTTTSYSNLVLKGDGPTERSSHINVGFDGVAFDIASAGFGIEGLSIKGNRALYPNSRAFRFAKTVNTDDMDARVRNVCLQEFGVAIEHMGRGFYLQDSIIALCDRATTFNWPTSGVSGTGLHVPPYGNRKWMIGGNHLHAVGVAFENLSTQPMRGINCVGNLMDIGRAFWRGAAIASVFGANTIENVSTHGFELIGSADDVQIIGNRIAGMPEPSPADSSIHQAITGVSISTPGTVRGLMVKNNNIRYVKEDGIRVNRALAESDISGNIIRDYALSGSAYSAIAVQNVSGLINAVSRTTIADNTGTAPVSPGVFLKLGGAVPSDCRIDNRC